MGNRILIIETDAKLRRLHRGFLAKYGYKVVAAATASEFDPELWATPPDLLIIDQGCCAGRDTLVKLCGHPVPVILTVPVHERVNWQHLTEPAVVDFLMTPVAPSKLLGSVRSALAKEVVICQKLKITSGDGWTIYNLLPQGRATGGPSPPIGPSRTGTSVRHRQSGRGAKSTAPTV